MSEKPLILFGLNADPPHLGHLHVIHQVGKLIPDALFIIVPAGDHPFAKQQYASKNDRFAMTKLLFRGNDQVQLDDFEVNKKGISYTLDTLIHLKTKYPEHRLYFIMASDVANQFFLWHKFSEIVAIATPLIIERSGYSLDEEVKQELLRLSHPLILSIPLLPLSSTQIRADLKKGAQIQGLCESVLAYIRTHHLYE